MITRAVLHPVHVPGLPEAIRNVADIDLVTPEDPGGVVDALEGGVPVLVTYAWDDRFLTAGLRWVQSQSVGTEQFPLGEFRRRGVSLTSARGAHTPAVAEHAIALVLALVRGVGLATRNATQGVWSVYRATEVAGRTLAVLGLGSIGEAVAERATALGMRVIGTKRDPATYRGVAVKVFPPEAIREVLGEADVAVVALPGGEATTGLIGAAELAALGEGWLVNVGRGAVVDEDALVAALRSGRLRGAGLDVFATEPLPDDSPLWAMDGVIVTPHVAWSSDRLPGRLAALFAANLAGYEGRGDWATRVD